MFQVSQIELDFAIEPLDDRIDEAGILGAVRLKLPEDRRMEPSDEVEDSGLDMVHIERVAEFGAVALDLPLLELVEGLEHVGAVVRFRIVPPHLDRAALDEQRIAHGGQIGFQLLRFGFDDREGRGVHVSAEIVAQSLKTSRPELACIQRFGKPPHRRQ